MLRFAEGKEDEWKRRARGISDWLLIRLRGKGFTAWGLSTRAPLRALPPATRLTFA